jgi:hypothetical protein
MALLFHASRWYAMSNNAEKLAWCLDVSRSDLLSNGRFSYGGALYNVEQFEGLDTPMQR